MEICPTRTCKYGGKRDRHHMFWPAHWYQTPTERAFRNLDCHIERDICRCLHDLEHLKKPPKKPPLEHMLAVLRREKG